MFSGKVKKITKADGALIKGSIEVSSASIFRNRRRQSWLTPPLLPTTPFHFAEQLRERNSVVEPPLLPLSKTQPSEHDDLPSSPDEDAALHLPV